MNALYANPIIFANKIKTNSFLRTDYFTKYSSFTLVEMD